MGAGRRGGGGAKSRRSSHYFSEKNTCGGILFFPSEVPFFMWGVIFSYEGVLGGLSPPPTPVLQRIVLEPMPPPHECTKKFSEGVGNPKKPLIKTKKDIKTKKTPPPHMEKK